MLTRAQLCPDEIPAAGEVVAVLVSEEQGLAPSLQLNCWLIRWRQIPAALIFGVLGAYLWAVLASIFFKAYAQALEETQISIKLIDPLWSNRK